MHKANLMLAVVEAAREYHAECDNPAPDLLYRVRCRDRLFDALTALDADPGFTVDQAALAVGLAYYPDPREPTAADMEAARAALRAVGYGGADE